MIFILSLRIIGGFIKRGRQMNPRLQEFCEFCELGWREEKLLPRYKHVIRPFYRLVGGDRYPLFSVPATFFTADFLFHQLHLLLF